MELPDGEVAARLAAAPGDDVCILRIEESEFGCEEQRCPPRLWLLVETADGQRFSREIAEAQAVELGLFVGGTCRLSQLL